MHSRTRLLSARILNLLSILLVGAISASAPATAQDRPTVGVVLSGGSAKGFAHIAILRMLEEEGVPVDIVTGTSMGSIVGGLYATGMSLDSLEVLVATLPWAELLGDRTRRSDLSVDSRVLDNRSLVALPLIDGRPGLPRAAREGAAIHRLLERLTWPWAATRDFARLPVPFGTVGTDLETGEAVELRGGVLADAIRASMALPSLLDPIRINGRTLVDGGLIRNLPAQDARDMGADVVICSDVGAPLAEIDDIADMAAVVSQITAYQATRSNAEQAELCDVMIRPDIDGLSHLAFDRGPEWIARGAAAAEGARVAVREFAGAPRVRTDVDTPLPPRLDGATLRLEGVETPEAERIMRGIIEDELRGGVDLEALDEASSRLSALGFFRGVRYFVNRGSDAPVVTFHATEVPSDELGVGLRWDTQFGASLLFESSFSHLLAWGSRTRASVRLGEEIQVEASTITGRGLASSLNLGARVAWSRSPVDLRVDESAAPVARVEIDVAELRAIVGWAPDRATLIALDPGVERTWAETIISEQDTAVTQWTGSLAALLIRDTHDDAWFPMSGLRALGRFEVGTSDAGEGGEFQHHVVDLSAALPLGDRLSLLFGGYLGHAAGDGVPLARTFFVGGLNTSSVYQTTQRPLAGLDTQARSGTSAQILRAGVRWRASTDMGLALRVDAGNAADSWEAASEDWATGWAVAFEWNSLFGPISVALNGRGRLDRTGLAVNVGKVF